MFVLFEIFVLDYSTQITFFQTTNKRLSLLCYTCTIYYRAIESERSGTRPESLSDGSLQLDKYNRLADIDEHLKKLKNENPEMVTLIEIGKSHENRSLTVVKVTAHLYAIILIASKIKFFEKKKHIIRKETFLRTIW